MSAAYEMAERLSAQVDDANLIRSVIANAFPDATLTVSMIARMIKARKGEEQREARRQRILAAEPDGTGEEERRFTSSRTAGSTPTPSRSPRRPPPPPKPPSTMPRSRSRPPSRSNPMPKRLPIMLLSSLLPMLTACGQPHVRAALPICPEPIVLPRSMTDPIPLPKWFPAPKPTTISSSQPQAAPLKCMSTPNP